MAFKMGPLFRPRNAAKDNQINNDRNNDKNNDDEEEEEDDDEEEEDDDVKPAVV